MHIAADHVRAPCFLFREASLKEPHMMILRSTPPSPFGRKVKLAASVLGLSGEIKVEPADTNDDNDSLRQQNPVGKIPVLVLEDGSTLLRLARDPRIPRSPRRRRQDHSG